MLFNCNGLQVHNQLLNSNGNLINNCFLVGSTNFSLPFSKWNNRETERLEWLKSRYRMWCDYTYKSLKNLDIPFSQSIWIIFMQKNDRKSLNIRRVELLSNGVILLFVEVEKLVEMFQMIFIASKWFLKRLTHM